MSGSGKDSRDGRTGKMAASHFKEKITKDMAVHGLHEVMRDRKRTRHQRLDQQRRSFSQSYLRDVESVMRELGRQGFLSLSNFSEGMAEGWQRIGRSSLPKNVIFYHKYTRDRLMTCTSPYFYLHFRGDKEVILSACREHGFRASVKNANPGLIEISRDFEIDFSEFPDDINDHSLK